MKKFLKIKFIRYLNVKYKINNIYKIYFSPVDIVSSKPSVAPLPSIEIFFIINMYWWTHISNKHNNIFIEHQFNPKYLYLPGSAFLINLAASNKWFYNVKSARCLYDQNFLISNININHLFMSKYHFFFL